MRTVVDVARTGLDGVVVVLLHVLKKNSIGRGKLREGVSPQQHYCGKDQCNAREPQASSNHSHPDCNG